MLRLVTTTYLEMTAPAQLRPAARVPALAVARAEIPCPELNRFLYTAVGSSWSWHARLDWTYADWLAHLDRPGVETWLGMVSGTPAGYFELERRDGGVVEIAYFGLLPRFTGRGFGGALLTAAVERAWAIGAERVWVHTCDLDHPWALDNYLARGFRVARQERRPEELPDHPLEPWPGALRPEGR